MITTQQKQDGTTEVVLEGARLDASVADSVKSQIKEVIDRGERHLVIDFSSVQFMDSSGLGALVGCLKMMGPGGQIEIINASSTVLKVLKLTRMNKIFNIRES